MILAKIAIVITIILLIIGVVMFYIVIRDEVKKRTRRK